MNAARVQWSPLRLTGAFLLVLDRIALGGLVAMILIVPAGVVVVARSLAWIVAKRELKAERKSRLQGALSVWALICVSLGSVRLDNWIARGRAESLIAAIERFEKDNGHFPLELDELVPTYLPTIPRAKPFTLGSFGEFWYMGTPPGHPEVEPFLSYTEIPPFGRVDYGFHRRRFGRLD